jgi:ATP-dependent exoDNAse (exonuclease V) beta subunit
VCELLSQAGQPDAGDPIEWVGPSSTHRLMVLRASGIVEELLPTPPEAAESHDAFERLAAAEAPRRLSATSLVSPVDLPKEAIDDTARPRTFALQTGILVHRALQAGLWRRNLLDDERRRAVAALVGAHERASVDDVEALTGRAVDILKAFELGGVADASLHEVPFSLRRPDGTIVRGAIDALVEHPDGRVEVLEFKTGRPLAEHAHQLALYLEAARAFFPTCRVEGRIIHADGQLSQVDGV